MKNQNYLFLLLLPFLFSCSNNDDNSGTDQELTLSGFVQKNYNVSSTPNVIIDSTYYQLQNNKIIYVLSFGLLTIFSKD